MEIIKYPAKKEWIHLIKRPEKDQKKILKLVHQVFKEIKQEGDHALKKYTLQFDDIKLKKIVVSQIDIKNSTQYIRKDLKKAIKIAKSNIEKFHRVQFEKKRIITTQKGINCWRENRCIEKVGIYIPGGSAPLFSTVLMLGIPAQIAGCREIILCTPPDKKGNIHPAILYTAQLIGIQKIYKIGGIQAIGAMTFGTKSIVKVDKIFGPGNQFVTAAKQISQHFGMAIDLPAGPSELLIIADKSARPEFIAADLLSQAEHGIDSQVILVTTTYTLVKKVLLEIKNQIKELPRQSIVSEALKNSKIIVLKNIESCIAFSNEYAPEHLILNVIKYSNCIKKITNAGSVFLGNYSCESAGDYASGTNHTLPTKGYAKNYSGVSLDSFLKKITFQEISRKGIQKLGPVIEQMASAEQLMAHKNAVTVRLKSK